MRATGSRNPPSTSLLYAKMAGNVITPGGEDSHTAMRASFTHPTASRRLTRAGLAVTALCVALSGAAYAPAAVPAAVPTDVPRHIVITGGAKSPTETQYLSSDYDPAKGYIVDSQRVRLDAGWDIPELSSAFPSHIIDLKWTITDTTKCFNLGTDPCPTSALRYPTLQCAGNTGQPAPACAGPGWDWTGVTDAALGCPAFPTSTLALSPGQTVTICTSSTLFPSEAASGLSYSLGYDPPYVRDTSHIAVSWPITDAWDPATGKPAPIKYRSWPCAGPASTWTGTTPPACDGSGAFRRVYSGPGYFGAAATVKLPAVPSNVALTLPDLPSLKSQAGYAYLEAWVHAGPDAVPWEFGLTYHQDTNTYSLYARGPDLYWTHGIIFNAGDEIRLSMSPYPVGHTNDPKWPALPGCADNNACLVAVADDLTTSHAYGETFNASGWSGNALMFARMTSIAQGMKPPYAGDIFNDGAFFGPITWEDAKLARVESSGIHTGTWAGGSSQSWPDDPRRVLVSGPPNPPTPAGETDTLNLHT